MVVWLETVARSLLTEGAMSPMLVVQVVDPSRRGTVRTHFFDRSPIAVGSDAACGLRLIGAGVPPNDGAFIFTASCIAYARPHDETAIALGRIDVRIGRCRVAAWVRAFPRVESEPPARGLSRTAEIESAGPRKLANVIMLRAVGDVSTLPKSR